MFFFNSDNPDSKKLTTEIIIPISSSPELLLIGYEKKQTNYHLYLLFSLFSVLLNQNK
jgi:hypothetical protein